MVKSLLEPIGHPSPLKSSAAAAAASSLNSLGSLPLNPLLTSGNTATNASAATTATSSHTSTHVSASNTNPPTTTTSTSAASQLLPIGSHLLSQHSSLHSPPVSRQSEEMMRTLDYLGLNDLGGEGESQVVRNVVIGRPSSAATGAAAPGATPSTSMHSTSMHSTSMHSTNSAVGTGSHSTASNLPSSAAALSLDSPFIAQGFHGGSTASLPGSGFESSHLTGQIWNDEGLAASSHLTGGGPSASSQQTASNFSLLLGGSSKFPSPALSTTNTLPSSTLSMNPPHAPAPATNAGGGAAAGYPSPALALSSTSPHKHQDASASRSLWVGNIDPTLTTEDLYQIFSPFGHIESIRLLAEKECAFINYETVESACDAKDHMQGAKVGSCIVRVGFGRSHPHSHVGGGPYPPPVQGPGSSTGMGYPDSANGYAISPAMFSQQHGPSSASALNMSAFGNVFVPGARSFGMEHHMTSGSLTNSLLLSPIASVASPASSTNLGGSHVWSPPSMSHSTVTLPGGVAPKSMAATFEFPPLNTASPSPQMPHFSKPPVVPPPQASVEDHERWGDLRVALSESSLQILHEFMEQQHQHPQAFSIPPLPPMNMTSKPLDIHYLREIKRRLDHPQQSSGYSTREMDHLVAELLPHIIELSTDAFGNTLVQRLIERATDSQRLRIMERCLNHLAGIGIHKNGTWVVQKLLEYSTKCPQHTTMLINALRPFTKLLMMDAFGNYVVQSCLKLGTPRNQFVFDVILQHFVEITHEKFGARSMRACLESEYAPMRERRLCAELVLRDAQDLVLDANGILLIHWLLDNSDLDGRYEALAKRFVDISNQVDSESKDGTGWYLPYLANQKLSHIVLMKLCIQPGELNAAQLIMDKLCSDEKQLQWALFSPECLDGGSHEFAALVLCKILQNLIGDKRSALIKRIQNVRDRQSIHAGSRHGAHMHSGLSKRLLDELERGSHHGHHYTSSSSHHATGTASPHRGHYTHRGRGVSH